MPLSSPRLASAAARSEASARLAVPAQLQPQVELRVQRQQHRATVVREHEGAAGEVAVDARTPHRVLVRGEEGEVVVAQRDLGLVRRDPDTEDAHGVVVQRGRGRCRSRRRCWAAPPSPGASGRSSRPERSSGADRRTKASIASSPSRSSGVGSRSGCSHSASRASMPRAAAHRLPQLPRLAQAAGAQLEADERGERALGRAAGGAAPSHGLAQRVGRGQATGRRLGDDVVDPALDEREQGLEPRERGELLGGVVRHEDARGEDLLHGLGVRRVDVARGLLDAGAGRRGCRRRRPRPPR